MSTMNDLAKRIRSSNAAYLNAGMDAGMQKAIDLLFVAAYELGMLKSPSTRRTGAALRRRDGTRRF